MELGQSEDEFDRYLGSTDGPNVGGFARVSAEVRISINPTDAENRTGVESCIIAVGGAHSLDEGFGGMRTHLNAVQIRRLRESTTDGANSQYFPACRGTIWLGAKE